MLINIKKRHHAKHSAVHYTNCWLDYDFLPIAFILMILEHVEVTRIFYKFSTLHARTK